MDCMFTNFIFEIIYINIPSILRVFRNFKLLLYYTVSRLSSSVKIIILLADSIMTFIAIIISRYRFNSHKVFIQPDSFKTPYVGRLMEEMEA